MSRSLGGQQLKAIKLKLFSRDESIVAGIISDATREVGTRIHSSPKGFGKDAYIELIIFGKNEEEIEKTVRFLRDKGLKFEIVKK